MGLVKLPELLAEARRWIAADPDSATRSELSALVEENAQAELSERFAAPLAFGTAGLRGVVGAGPARMNRAVVIRAAHGFARWLLERVPDARGLPVVLGWDARPSSRVFAEDTAGVFAAAGLTVRFFDEPVPTPLVAFAARELGACGAVVVTASHNPPEYNGYKLYGPDAAQIAPPADREIAERISTAPAANEVRRVERALDGDGVRVSRVPPGIVERYLTRLDALRPPGAARRDFGIVYTPLHGVGRKLATSALRSAGFAEIHVVEAQAEPDGAFPTLRFPNPEEPGALTLALELAEATGAELILANDPDADRLAACVRAPDGSLVQLTGNQLGVLLGDFVLSHAPASPKPLAVTTLVSSPMMAAIARAHAARFELTHTGFKWIWLAARALEVREGVRFAFGYEEALGYCVGGLVRDKDGISAALLCAELAAQCRAQGQTLLDRLGDLYRRHGLWVSAQRAVVRPGSRGRAAIERAMDLVAQSPPNALAGRAVSAMRDFRRANAAEPAWLAQAPLVELTLGDAGRALMRPSGTEPKLKIYVDLRVDLGPTANASEREQRVLGEASEIAEALVQALGLDVA